MKTNFILAGLLQYMFVCTQGVGVNLPVVGKRNENPDHFSMILLHNYLNLNYYGYIWLGTPRKKDGKLLERKKLFMLFDTGSSDIIVYGSGYDKQCNKEISKKKCGKKNPQVYDPAESETYRRTDGSFSVTFVDESHMSGHLATDFLEIGEGESKIRVKIQFGIADHVENDATDSDGVFGLGFGLGSMFNNYNLTPLQSIFNVDLPAQIGYYVQKEKDPGRDVIDGIITIGGYNPNYVTSDFFASVKLKKIDGMVHGWEFDFERMYVGGKMISLEGKQGVVDSGSSIIGLPQDIFDQVMPQILQGSIEEELLRKPKFQCSLLPKNLPDISFELNGKQLPIGSEEYIVTSTNGSSCFIAILSLGHTDELILGNPFLQKYYALFDYKEKEILFARLKKSDVKLALPEANQGNLNDTN